MPTVDNPVETGFGMGCGCLLVPVFIVAVVIGVMVVLTALGVVGGALSG